MLNQITMPAGNTQNANPHQIAIDKISNAIDIIENIEGYLGDIIEHCHETSDHHKARRYQSLANHSSRVVNRAYSQLSVLYDVDASGPLSPSENIALISVLNELAENLESLGYFGIDSAKNDNELENANHDWLLFDSDDCTALADVLSELSDTLKGGN